jgi:6-phosphofructokinase 2
VSVITTLTMNPALDIYTTVPHLMHTEKMRCSAPRRDAGGGGVNVARAILALGGAATAVVTTGDDAGARLLRLIERDEIPVRAVDIENPTRESLVVTDESTRLQYRFVLPGPALTARDESRCLSVLEQNVADNGYLVVSGSLPPGCSEEFFSSMDTLARSHQCRLIVDTSGSALSWVKGAYLIKPSIRELRDCVGAALPDVPSQAAAARDLISANVSEVVVISLGSAGALLVTTDEIVPVPSTPVSPGNGVGAGDNMVAGITVALDQGWGLVEAVRFGSAAGAAATLTPGSQPCVRVEADRLYKLLSTAA